MESEVMWFDFFLFVFLGFVILTHIRFRFSGCKVEQVQSRVGANCKYKTAIVFWCISICIIRIMKTCLFLGNLCWCQDILWFRVLRHSFRTKHVRHQTLKLKIVNILRRKGLTVSDISHVVLFESEKLVSLFLCFFFVAVSPFWGKACAAKGLQNLPRHTQNSQPLLSTMLLLLACKVMVYRKEKENRLTNGTIEAEEWGEATQ